MIHGQVRPSKVRLVNAHKNQLTQLLLELFSNPYLLTNQTKNLTCSAMKKALGKSETSVVQTMIWSRVILQSGQDVQNHSQNTGKTQGFSNIFFNNKKAPSNYFLPILSVFVSIRQYSVGICQYSVGTW